MLPQACAYRRSRSTRRRSLRLKLEKSKRKQSQSEKLSTPTATKAKAKEDQVLALSGQAVKTTGKGTGKGKGCCEAGISYPQDVFLPSCFVFSRHFSALRNFLLAQPLDARLSTHYTSFHLLSASATATATAEIMHASGSSHATCG